MHQKTFAELAYENKKKQPRRERFLVVMEKVLPWKKLLRPLLKAYPQGARGRPPIELEQMLRIYFLLQWYQYSVPMRAWKTPGMRAKRCGSFSEREKKEYQTRQRSASFAITWRSMN